MQSFSGCEGRHGAVHCVIVQLTGGGVRVDGEKDGSKFYLKSGERLMPSTQASPSFLILRGALRTWAAGGWSVWEEGGGGVVVDRTITYRSGQRKRRRVVGCCMGAGGGRGPVKGKYAVGKGHSVRLYVRLLCGRYM